MSRTMLRSHQLNHFKRNRCNICGNRHRRVLIWYEHVHKKHPDHSHVRCLVCDERVFTKDLGMVNSMKTMCTKVFGSFFYCIQYSRNNFFQFCSTSTCNKYILLSYRPDSKGVYMGNMTAKVSSKKVCFLFFLKIVQIST